MKILPEISVSAHLHLVDWFVFFLIFLLTIACIYVGNKIAKKNLHPDSLIEYLLLGRRLTLPMFVGTLVATWYGGIFGVTKIAFESGLFNFLTQGVFWYFAYILFAFFIVDRVSRYEAVTLPELVGKMFGRRSAKLAAFFTFFNVVPISYVISLGLLSQIIFKISFFTGMFVGTMIVCFYSMWGGFKAVVFSDIVQFFVMCMSVFFVLVFSISSFGGLQYLRANIPSTHFNIMGKETVLTTIIWGFIALSTLVDPNFYQRCFAAKNKKVAKYGILISTLIWCLFDICTTFGALYARAAIPEADSRQAYFLYSIQVLPPGLRGLFIAGILATILSTLDSYLFIAANTVSYDFLKTRVKNVIIANQISLFVVGFMAILLGLFFEGDIREVWKTLGSYSAACLLVPVLTGYIFPGKISDNIFVMSSVMGVIGVTFWRFFNQGGFWKNIDSFYIGLFMSVLGISIGLIFNNISFTRMVKK